MNNNRLILHFNIRNKAINNHPQKYKNTRKSTTTKPQKGAKQKTQPPFPAVTLAKVPLWVRYSRQHHCNAQMEKKTGPARSIPVGPVYLVSRYLLLLVTEENKWDQCECPKVALRTTTRRCVIIPLLQMESRFAREIKQNFV